MKVKRGLMSISDFSAFCGTTRQALQYYDRIGLLQPLQRGDQGYRYYHTLQGHEVRFIHFLQRSGCSLKEIKGILDSPDIETLREHVEEKQKLLELQLQRVKREQVMLRRFLRFQVWAEQLPVQTPILQRSRQPIHLDEAVNVERFEPYSHDYYQMVKLYADYCRENHTVQAYPYVLYVNAENLKEGHSFSKILCFPEHIEIPAAHSFVLLPGEYICMLAHPEQMKDIRPEAYKTMLAFADERGLKPLGGALEIPYCIPRGLQRDGMQFSVVFILPVASGGDGERPGGEEA